MPNMNGIINAQTNGEDNVSAGKDVNADIPEVEKTNGVNEGETNRD